MSQETSSERTMGTRVAEFGLNLIMALTLFALFVAAFFFLVASQIEVRAVKSNTKRVIQELFSTVQEVIPSNVKDEVYTELSQVELPASMADVDDAVHKSNQDLVKNTSIVMGSVAAGGSVIVFLVWWGMRYRAGPSGQAGIHYPDMRHLILENLILLAFVAITEFLFMFLIAANYRSLDPNRIRRQALQTLTDFIHGA